MTQRAGAIMSRWTSMMRGLLAQDGLATQRRNTRSFQPTDGLPYAVRPFGLDHRQLRTRLGGREDAFGGLEPIRRKKNPKDDFDLCSAIAGIYPPRFGGSENAFLYAGEDCAPVLVLQARARMIRRTTCPAAWSFTCLSATILSSRTRPLMPCWDGA